MRRYAPGLLVVLGLVGLVVWAFSAPTKPPADLPPATVAPAQPPPPPAPGGLAFCVFGDCRTGGDPSRLKITMRLAAAMAAEHPRVVLATGDYIDGSRRAESSQAQLADFLRALSPLQSLGPVPLAAAVGNHDRALSPDALRQVFGPPYYSFNLEDCHFVVLDTEQPGASGRIDGKQWEWLVQDLRDAQGARLRFVVLHQPLFPVGPHRGSSLDRYPLLRDRLHFLFVQQNVACVFQGHEHLYNRQERDGVNYVITGGGGAPLYADELRGGFYHYLRVDVTARDYTVAVKRLD